MLFYISHPSSGLQENTDKVESIIHGLVKDNPADTYISAIHVFGFMYNTVPHEQGLNMCLELLARCDKMLVYGDWSNSRGCLAEVAYCKSNNIPYRIIDDAKSL